MTFILAMLIFLALVSVVMIIAAITLASEGEVPAMILAGVFFVLGAVCLILACAWIGRYIMAVQNY